MESKEGQGWKGRAEGGIAHTPAATGPQQATQRRQRTQPLQQPLQLRSQRSRVEGGQGQPEEAADRELPPTQG